MVASFDDGKDDGALRTIGEVGEALGLKAHVLRYWEGQFPQLQPMKRSGGRRYYRPEDVALLREIDRLVNAEGYTLKGAKAALADFRADGDGVANDTGAATEAHFSGSAAPRVMATDNREAIARLREIRTTLAAALER
ncbi:MerR family transcriptional regulator [Tsuneonella amylolytica]|uniref:MerR family transcriptional regulator n=1 Tax=Tsuneonella amylolytica TaxID=2338327 RepID=UPI000EA94626|nr:MerR family transcriptional regulator [Tsuneonella amylolytica]